MPALTLRLENDGAMHGATKRRAFASAMQPVRQAVGFAAALVDRPAPPQPWRGVRSAADPPIIAPMPAARRFPPPWTIEKHNDACFIVKDATGQVLGYFYFEDEPGRRSEYLVDGWLLFKSFDDPNVANSAITERLQCFLIGRAVVRRNGLL